MQRPSAKITSAESRGSTYSPSCKTTIGVMAKMTQTNEQFVLDNETNGFVRAWYVDREAPQGTARMIIVHVIMVHACTITLVHACMYCDGRCMYYDHGTSMYFDHNFSHVCCHAYLAHGSLYVVVVTFPNDFRLCTPCSSREHNYKIGQRGNRSKPHVAVRVAKSAIHC